MPKDFGAGEFDLRACAKVPRYGFLGKNDVENGPEQLLASSSLAETHSRRLMRLRPDTEKFVSEREPEKFVRFFLFLK
jgi:hypothetical protein